MELDKGEGEKLFKASNFSVLETDLQSEKREGDDQIAAVAPQEGAIVPFDLARGHGLDGQLLRDFVNRGEHLKPQHRDFALKRWLIRTEFFDRHFEDYVQHYASQGASSSSGEAEQRALALEEEASELTEACKGILAAKDPKRKVEQLETTAAAKGDVYALRDTLLEAVKELSVPRRKLNAGTGIAMDQSAKDLLKVKVQGRLRQVVFNCLKSIWDSGVGGEVLSMALDSVKSRIDKFKAKAGEDADVIDALAGQQWAHLEDLVGIIEDKLQEETGDTADSPGEGGRKPLGPIEGRRTKQVIERALAALGGRGTSREVVEWIEENPGQLEHLREARLNRNVRDGCKKPVWHGTVASMCGGFRKVKRVAGQPQVYLSADAPEEEEPLPIQDQERQAAIEGDGEARQRRGRGRGRGRGGVEGGREGGGRGRGGRAAAKAAEAAAKAEPGAAAPAATAAATPAAAKGQPRKRLKALSQAPSPPADIGGAGGEALLPTPAESVAAAAPGQPQSIPPAASVQLPRAEDEVAPSQKSSATLHSEQDKVRDAFDAAFDMAAASM